MNEEKQEQEQEKQEQEQEQEQEQSFNLKEEFEKMQNAFDEKLSKIKSDYEKTIRDQQDIINQLLVKPGEEPAKEPDLIDIKITEINSKRDKQNKI